MDNFHVFLSHVHGMPLRIRFTKGSVGRNPVQKCRNAINSLVFEFIIHSYKDEAKVL